MTEKRLRDMEKSVKLIADYVKQHTDKIETQMKDFRTEMETVKSEEMLGSGGLREEVDELKKKLDSFSTEKHVSPLKMKGIEQFEDRITGRIDRLEERIANVHSGTDGKTEKKLGDALSAMRKDIEDLRHELNPKMHFLEGKMNKVREDLDDVSGSVNMDELHEKMEHLDRKLTQSLSMNSRLDEVENAVKGMTELEKRLQKGEHHDVAKISEELKSSLNNIDTKIKETEERITKRDAEEFRKVYDEVAQHVRNETEIIRKDMQAMQKARDAIETQMKAMETKLNEREATDFKKLYS